MHTILIVDDSPADIQVLSETLKPEYNVKAATSAQRAVTVINKNKPDLILLDVLLPGMDGYEFCQRLTRHPATRAIPVIFVTGNVTEEEKSRGFDAGGKAFLSKPIDSQQLLSLVQRTLR